MRDDRILICDTDKSYTEALVRYLMSSRKGLRVAYNTTLESFRKERGDFRIALMTDEFLREDEASYGPDLRIHEKIELCSGTECPEGDYETLYKFQSMDEFTKRLFRKEWEKDEDEPGRHTVPARLIGVYSPIRHELTLPFSLLYARMLGERKRVLFVDLQANSTLRPLIGRDPESTVLDAVFELTQDPDGFELGRHLEPYEGFSILPPVLHPTDLCGIETGQWMDLLTRLQGAGYEYVVLLFGEIPQGFPSFLERMDKMLLLGKPGPYFRPAQDSFRNFLLEERPDLEIEDVNLPMSAGNVSGEGLAMEEMMQGKLGAFLRRQFGECDG